MSQLFSFTAAVVSRNADIILWSSIETATRIQTLVTSILNPAKEGDTLPAMTVVSGASDDPIL